MKSMSMQPVNNNLTKTLIIKFFGTFGSEMLSFAISLYILRRTGSALGMGVSLITGPLISVCLTPFVGYAVDSYSHKKIMVASQLGTIISLLLFAFCFTAFPQAYFLILVVLIALLAITDGFLTTAVQASLAQLFNKDDLQKANSLNQSISSLAEFLAPVLGAVVYTLVTLNVFAYLEVIFETVALIAILVLKFTKIRRPISNQGMQTEATENHLGSNFMAGLRFLWENKLYLMFSGSSGVINFFFATINVGLPFFLVDRLHLSNTQYGLTESAFAGGMFLGGLVLSRLPLKNQSLKVAYFSLAVFSLIIALIGLPSLLTLPKAAYALVFITINLVLGLLLVFSNTPVEVYMQQHIPEEMQGRVFSMDETLSSVLMPAGTIVFGILFDRLDVFAVFIFGGFMMLLLSCWAFVVINHHRETALISEQK
ncbi:MFS transporter [Oenococcus kitaharae]|uniref:MFS transporter n=1 Tax=Oenococcus TaxID=46254 RepID=UPI0021E84725|nr:MFS transporter [Oenococcus kitaharae]MCV3296886.1 MFS transporter [Oenococcus kitaharae]